MWYSSDVVLLDVTPQSLGVAIAGGYVRRLIPKNTTVPTSVTEVFNTSKDSQTTVKIMVLQGEADIAHQNELLGEFILTGLRDAKRGEVEIEVTWYFAIVDTAFDAEKWPTAATNRITLAPGAKRSSRSPLGASPMVKWCQTKPKLSPCELVNSGRYDAKVTVE